MKTTRLLTGILAVSLVTFTVLTGCKKEKSELNPQEEEQIAMASTEGDAEGENAFNDVFDDVLGANNEVGMEGTGIFGGRTTTDGSLLEAGRGMQVDSLPACVTVSVIHLSTTSIFPVKIIIDFGTGCQGRDGRIRSGRIISVYTGRLITPGSQSTTTFDNYRVDSIGVQGTLVIKNTSTPPTAGNLPIHQFTFDVINGKLTRPNGNYTEWNSHRVVSQVEGMLTPTTPLDDVYAITGHANGSVHRGTFVCQWDSNIIEPLRKRFLCRWITKGKIKVMRRNLSSTSPWVAVLDYGAGTCDRNATLTVNGVTHQILLH
jgi:hypothetical protein